MNNVKLNLFFSPIVRIVLEICLESFFSIYLQFHFATNDSIERDVVSFIIAILFIIGNAFLIIAPPIMLYLKSINYFGIRFAR